MTRTKKVMILLIIYFLIFINPGELAYAALPHLKVLQGNSTRLGLKLVTASGTTVSEADIETAITVIATRLDRLGVTTKVVERSALEGEHLAVTLPPGSDLERIKEVIRYSGLLELKPLAKGTQIPYPTKEAAENAAKGLTGGPYEVFLYRARPDEGGSSVDGYVVLEKTPVVTGSDMRKAMAISNDYNRTDYQIDFSLTPEGTARLSDWTGRHIGEHLAIVLNNEVKSAPIIQGQISDRGQISGGFSKRSAENLAIILISGTLPHKLEVVNEQLIPSKSLAQKPIVSTGVSGLTLAALIADCFFVVSRRTDEAQNSR
jgi:preprotein translocase subunit SecD